MLLSCHKNNSDKTLYAKKKLKAITKICVLTAFIVKANIFHMCKDVFLKWEIGKKKRLNLVAIYIKLQCSFLVFQNVYLIT